MITTTPGTRPTDRISRWAGLLLPLVVTLASLAIAPINFAHSPLIDHVEWAHPGGLSSLRVFPTPAGRAAAGLLGIDDEEAWSEVLVLSPGADSDGMREQFDCHWRFAEFA